MANYCSNIVQFEGDGEKLKQLQKFFEALAAKETKERQGQLPAFVQLRSGYLFSIRWENDLLYYETKWAPNIEMLIAIADHFETGFTHSFDEPGMQVHGEAVYKDGNITVIDLNTEDYALLRYDREKDNWIFEGATYESDFEILEILLERKKLNKLI